MIVKRIIPIIAIALAFSACEPEEDRKELATPIPKSDIAASVVQDSENSNYVYVHNSTSGALTLWEWETGYSNNPIDTLYFPFDGDYNITLTVYAGGMPVSLDPFQINIPDPDPEYFSHPFWNLLTNGSEGKTWVLWSIYVGPESNYEENWFEPDLVEETDIAGDEIYFDLNQAQNLAVTHLGETEWALFNLTPQDSIIEPRGIFLPGQDFGDDGFTTSKWKIHELTEIRMVIGQGASFIEERSDEDWSWYAVYIEK